MTRTTDDRARLALDEARRTWRQHAEDLKADCLRLADALQRAAAECDRALAEQPVAINPLGIVQGAGLDIDRQCALLQAAAETVALLKWVATEK